MSNLIRQGASTLLLLAWFMVVIIGAGAAGLGQVESTLAADSDTPLTSNPTSTLRIIVLPQNSPTMPSPTPTVTGTKMATEPLMATPSASITPSMTATATSFSVQCQPPVGWRLYTVQSGDNLYRISLKFRVSISLLQKANCLGNSTTIISGQLLWVPNVATSTPDVTETARPQPTHTPQPTPTIMATEDIPTDTPEPTGQPTEESSSPSPTETTAAPTKSEP
ncbi:MAG: LysM peptidoglycan-binding domain-containing protein [Anaerolineae bacterium]|nr:LysM peptidoglycan-binding domain-containing protein [Anaerolineae bacterium]